MAFLVKSVNLLWSSSTFENETYFYNHRFGIFKWGRTSRCNFKDFNNQIKDFQKHKSETSTVFYVSQLLDVSGSLYLKIDTDRFFVVFVIQNLPVAGKRLSWGERLLVTQHFGRNWYLDLVTGKPWIYPTFLCQQPWMTLKLKSSFLSSKHYVHWA